MSVCTFLASDKPLAPFSPPRDYPADINLDTGVIDDGGANDNFFLLPFDGTDSYTDKKYGVSLEWNYTDGRAERLIEYIKNSLENTDSIEVWHVWLTDYYEYDDRPVVRKFITTSDELEISDIRAFDKAQIWNNKDKNRPSFYCLTVRK